jgi:hypothetical protein
MDPGQLPSSWLDAIGHGGTIVLLTGIWNELRSQRKRLEELEKTHKQVEIHGRRLKKLARGLQEVRTALSRFLPSTGSSNSPYSNKGN